MTVLMLLKVKVEYQPLLFLQLYSEQPKISSTKHSAAGHTYILTTYCDQYWAQNFVRLLSCSQSFHIWAVHQSALRTLQMYQLS